WLAVWIQLTADPCVPKRQRSASDPALSPGSCSAHAPVLMRDSPDMGLASRIIRRDREEALPPGVDQGDRHAGAHAALAFDPAVDLSNWVAGAPAVRRRGFRC